MTYEQITDTVRTRRTRLGMSQGALADYAEYSQASLSQFERGKKQIKFGSLIRLLDALGLKFKAGIYPVNTPEELYGIFGSTMLKLRWGHRQLADACGIPVQSVMYWSRYTMAGMEVRNVLTACRALGLETDITEA